ncbi:hypothetical protein GGS26DRAFT_592472 [Hypomontagnella submonticulosa]|nr:hypothetical protein GGS26DRAFT_592472 [Hypomontagnella submonticulosa]
MEAIVAFSLAANIAQFVAIAGKTVEKTLELSVSRKTLLDENADLERIVTDFVDIVPLIKDVGPDSSGNDHKLRALAEDAKRIADDIQDKLNAIRARRAKRRHTEILYTTLKELRMKDDLDSLKSRLSDFRSEITLHINLNLLRYQSQIQKNLIGNMGSIRAYKERIGSQLTELLDAVRVNTFPKTDEEGNERNVWNGNSKQLEDLADGLRSWHPRMLEFQKVTTIVVGLEFCQIETRRDSIMEAYCNTYQWVFDGEVANFKTWLAESDAPVYWITGNAGSGKSTLMKYLIGHPRLQSMLTIWARDRTIYFASYFFWSIGVAMHRSQEGLLRTLLFQVLLERPDLTSRAFPAMWTRPVHHWEASGIPSWTIKELLEALLLLCSAIGPDFLFIFIDGLDEYEGEHDTLLELIRSLGRTSGIKLCVSSRPSPDFRDAFEDNPWKLYLHDLTGSDIETYTRAQLEHCYHSKQSRLRGQNATQGLVNKITTRAQGVFLWVFLVVRSLVRGFIFEDSIEDLHRRLDDLPHPLEDFFDQILVSIDNLYKSQTARLLLVLAHSRTPMTLLSFYFLDREEGLPFDSKSFLRDWPNVNSAELEAVDTKKRQLIAQCNDLIQIVEQPNAPVLFNFQATFLHRTVIDFVKSPRISDRLLHDAGFDFNPVVALFELNATQFQSLIHLLPRVYLKPYLRNWYLASIYYAREIEVSLNRSVAKQLDKTTNCLMGYLEDRAGIRYSFEEALRQLLADQDVPEAYCPLTFLDLCISCGLRLYVSDIIDPETAEYKIAVLKALNPMIYIEQASDFLIKPVPSNLQLQRCPIPPSAEKTYSSTFHMFTDADVELMQKLQNERVRLVQIESSPQIHNTGSCEQVGRLGVPITRIESKLGYWARLRRKLLR